MDERREHQRFNLEYTIQVISDTGDMVLTALTTDVSDGGVRMPMPSQAVPDTGEDIQVNLTIRRNDTGEVEMYTGLGKVLRQSQPDENGMSEVAMQFHAPMELRLDKTPSPAVNNDLV